jgi:hypothetical protein
MGTVPLPPKQNLPKELFDVATTLSPEAQNAALKKAQELGFDLQRGRIPLQETMINLNQAREVLVDAINQNKLVQLPLKLQYTLFSEAQRVSQNLSALISGTDAVLAMEDAVDDLTSSIWQYNLQNLSGQVLGFAQKMNQLKSQEILIRQVHREAENFESVRERVGIISNQLEESVKIAEERSARSKSFVDEIGSDKAKAESRLAEIEVVKSSISANLLNSEQAASRATSSATEADLSRSRANEAEAALVALQAQFASGLDDLHGRTEASLEYVRNTCETVISETKANLELTTNSLTGTITTLSESTHAGLEKATIEVNSALELARSELSALVETTGIRLRTTEENQSVALKATLDAFAKQSDARLEELGSGFSRMADAAELRAQKSVSDNDAELQRLTLQLQELEGRIRDSIERATGYTLFHSFQKRQEDLGRAKRFWAWALAGAVGVSLIASGIFIWSLRYVHVYDAAFYLKLSISLPIIYAIAFCSLQYSRERRLEEEYAFKSNISISLDPYQRLVKQLIDENKPDELAKYTAFVIESVNRVFTSPTEHVFEEYRKAKNPSAEKLLKSIKELLEPILSALARK